MKSVFSTLLAVFALGAWSAHGGDKGNHAPGADESGLKNEIAALEAKARGGWPEFEAEQRAWEAEVMQPAPDGTTKLPANIRTILALEPSEREPKQRAELAAYFRPLSKTFAELIQRLKTKRAALAALKAAAVPARR